MKLHPEASEVIDISTIEKQYSEISKKFELADPSDDYLKQLTVKENYRSIEREFQIKEEDLIKGEVFNDPALFANWATINDRKKVMVPFDLLSLNNYNWSKKGQKGDDISNKKKRGRPTKKKKGKKNGEEEEEEDNQEEEEKERDNLVFKLNINKAIINKNLSINNKQYLLDEVLKKSKLHSVQFNSRVKYLYRKKEGLNEVVEKEEDKEEVVCKEDQLTEDNFIYAIDLYQSKKKPYSKYQSFLMYDEQTLCELRDKFYCISDFLAYSTIEDEKRLEKMLDESLLPNVINVNRKNELDTFDKKTSPSFFFIENIFYNDNRSNLNQDLSKPLIQWSQIINKQNQKNNLPLFHYSAEDMSQVKLKDIQLRLNQPYLFYHQNHCQHLFLFRKIRKFNPMLDKANKSLYPVFTYKSRLRKMICRACGLFQANHITLNDKLSGANPCLFCDHCYEPFHFDEKNQPLYSFLHFPYNYH
ncbi:hypothetical protein K502DRAFT_325619 [Neoconidiobolus thromboides FSU 785]|nr:hypothetical protein K502DRAFT_325619 [Neoconidiobolus thromboides FSU 785]